ncbi:MAG: hypothetical protein ACR65U_00580 [Methylocystis sp.]
MSAKADTASNFRGRKFFICVLSAELKRHETSAAETLATAYALSQT